MLNIPSNETSNNFILIGAKKKTEKQTINNKKTGYLITIILILRKPQISQRFKKCTNNSETQLK